METTLQEMFDEMLTHVKEFRKKTYNEVFEAGYSKYRADLVELEGLLACEEEPEKAMLIERLAQVLPSYAYEKIQEKSKKEKERMGVDFNINMVVYIVPFINYSKNEECIKLAHRIVELWNEKKINSLTLSYSTYEEIAGGFRKKLCYITTAVCEHMNKSDDCYELTLMREFRDNYMMQTEKGRSTVEDYYDIAPGLVLIMNMQNNASDIYRELYLNYLLPCVQLFEEGKKTACQALYTQMVQKLKQQYI